MTATIGTKTAIMLSLRFELLLAVLGFLYDYPSVLYGFITTVYRGPVHLTRINSPCSAQLM